MMETTNNTEVFDINSPQYDPNMLLDGILEQLNLKNDAVLSRALEVAPPVLSKIRHRRIPVGPMMLIRMHELTGSSIQELRSRMGDRREKFSLLGLATDKRAK
jgi:hypothetical protein